MERGRDGGASFEPEPVELDVTDVLDLHSFPPRDVAELVRDWLDLTYESGFRKLRIVHGRGIGVQRRIVRSILEKDPRVVAFADAPSGEGGWGATRVEMSDPGEPADEPAP